MGFNVNTLPDYVEQHKSELIAKTLLNAPSIKNWIAVQTDVVGTTALNNVIADVVFQNGDECGFSDNGSVEISQRMLEPRALKVNLSLCPKQLKNKFLNTEIQISAKGQNLPAEEAIVTELVNAIINKVENQIWSGADAADSIKGFYHTITGDAIIVNGAASDTATEFLNKIYMAIPSAVINSGKEVCIFVSTALYRQYTIENSDTFHNPTNYGDGWCYLKGSNVKVVGTAGLDSVKSVYGQEKAYAGLADDFVFGCDLINDNEEFVLFWDESDRVYKFIVEFNGATQIRFPDRIVNATKASE